MKISQPALNIDLVQEKKIKWIIVGLGALTGVVAWLIYLDQKKHNKVQKEIFALDREIKRLQLQKLKNGGSADL